MIEKKFVVRRNKFIIFFSAIFILSLLIRFSDRFGNIIDLLFEPFLRGPRYFLYTVFDDLETIFTKNEQVRHGLETLTWVGAVGGIASKFIQLEAMHSQVKAFNRTLTVVDSKLLLRQTTSNVRLCDIFVFPKNIKCATLSPSVVVRKMSPRCTRPPPSIVEDGNRTLLPFKVDQYGLRKGSTRLLAPSTTLRFNDTHCALAHGLSFPVGRQEDRLPIIFQRKYQEYLKKAKKALGLSPNHTSYYLSHDTEEFIDPSFGSSSSSVPHGDNDGVKRHSSKKGKSKSRVWRRRRRRNLRSGGKSDSSSSHPNPSKGAESLASKKNENASSTADPSTVKSRAELSNVDSNKPTLTTSVRATDTGHSDDAVLTVIHWQKGLQVRGVQCDQFQAPMLLSVPTKHTKISSNPTGGTVAPRLHTGSCITPISVANFIALVKNVTQSHELSTSSKSDKREGTHDDSSGVEKKATPTKKNIIYIATDIEDPKVLKSLSNAGFKRYRDLNLPIKLTPLDSLVVELELMIESDVFFSWGATDTRDFVVHARMQRAIAARKRVTH
jgi:hypothetical protein